MPPISPLPFLVPDPFRFSFRLRVRWADVDPQRVVFNGHYLTYYDVAITEYWRAMGIGYPVGEGQDGGDFFVRKATLDYHASARYDDLLDIAVRAGRIGQSSIQFRLAIYRTNTQPTGGELPAELLNDGEIIYVNVDPLTRRPTPIANSLRARIEAFERTPPNALPTRNI